MLHEPVFIDPGVRTGNIQPALSVHQSDTLAMDYIAPGTVNSYDDSFYRAVDQALPGLVETYTTAHSAYRDGVQQARWLARWSGIGEPVLPEHWR